MDRSLIVGTVHVNNKSLYKFNSSTKKAYHLFSPFNRMYPRMLVILSSLRPHNTFWNVCVRYLHWNRGQFPIGEVTHEFGSSKNVKSCESTLLYHHMRLHKKKRNKFKKTDFNSILTKEVSKRDLVYNAYSIDPPGCCDIDDAISLETNSANLVVKIHISDVAFWCNKLKLDTYLDDQGFTFYTKNQRYDMFPPSLIDVLSLKENEWRLAISLFVTINPNSFKILDTEFKKTAVKCKKNYSYYEKQWVSKDVNKLMTICEKIFDCKLMGKCEMIEKYMIFYNQTAAEWLHKNQCQFIRRVQNDPTKQYSITETHLPLKFVQFYENMHNSAFYSYNTDSKHYGLNVNAYGHFTSGIRRGADVRNQKALHNLIDPTKKIKIKWPNILSLNMLEKCYKQIQRNMDQLQLISALKPTTMCKAIIYSISVTSIELFIKDYNILCTYNYSTNPNIIKCIYLPETLVVYTSKYKIIELRKFQEFSGSLIRINNFRVEFDFTLF